MIIDEPYVVNVDRMIRESPPRHLLVAASFAASLHEAQ
jgi:hypothetical protein